MTVIGFAPLAAADPCEAELPSRAGTEFGGAVRHIIDGDSLCVGPDSGDGSTWIEVRLMDFDAPEAREAGGAQATAILRQMAMDQEIQCLVTRSARNGSTRSFDRVHAVCRINGVLIGDLMRQAGVEEGGN
jgi:endonuclease YncB( thermonuclease family)